MVTWSVVLSWLRRLVTTGCSSRLRVVPSSSRWLYKGFQTGDMRTTTFTGNYSDL